MNRIFSTRDNVIGKFKMDKWTTEIPSEPGFYWFRCPAREVEHMVVALYRVHGDSRLRLGVFSGHTLDADSLRGQYHYCYIDKVVAAEQAKGIQIWWSKIEPPAVVLPLPESVLHAMRDALVKNGLDPANYVVSVEPTDAVTGARVSGV